MEQVVMLTLIGVDALKSAGELLCQILLPGSSNQSQNAGDHIMGEDCRSQSGKSSLSAIFVIARTL